MAEVRLGHYEATHGPLPPICMRCGAPASTQATKTFFWRPEWVTALLFLGVFPYIIAARMVGKKIQLVAPFCDRHKGHWFLHTLGIWGGAAVFVGFVILYLALLNLVVGIANAAEGLLCGIPFLTFLTWLAVAVVAHETSIHAKETSEHSLTLVRVSDEFAQALSASRTGRGEGTGPNRGGSEQYYSPKR